MSAFWSVCYITEDARSPGERLLVAARVYRETAEQGIGRKYNGSPALALFRDESRLARRIFAGYDPRRGGWGGILFYPAYRGLWTMSDSFHQGVETLAASRAQRAIYRAGARPRTTADSEYLDTFYIPFLARLSGDLDAEIVHVLFQRSPSSYTTAVRFYQDGALVDDYYSHESSDPVSEPAEHPEIVERFQDGRWKFLLRSILTDHGMPWDLPEGAPDPPYVWTWFYNAEELGSRKTDSRLYVPFWVTGLQSYGIITHPHGGCLPSPWLWWQVARARAASRWLNDSADPPAGEFSTGDHRFDPGDLRR